MSALRGCAHGLRRLAGAVGIIALMVVPVLGWADTVRLKNGTAVDGDIVRSDGTQVTVVVHGQPQFFPAGEVDRIIYSQWRIVPPPATPISASPVEQPSRPGSAILEAVGERLQALHELARRLRYMVQRLQHGYREAAVQTARVTLQEILPVRHGRFSPLYALSDVLILLGLRAPTIWLALLLVKEPRAMTRIAEFLVLAYGVAMLLTAWTIGVGAFWVQVLVIPVVSSVIACLFAWMFSLALQRAAFALLLTVGMNLGVEYLLTSAHFI